MKVFVYGTLMSGQGANGRLAGAKLLGKAILRDYEMFSLGEFPGIGPCMGGSVVGELYEANEELIPDLDSYEGEDSLYNREMVKVYTYSDKYTDQCPSIFEEAHYAYAYIYKDKAENHDRQFFGWGTTEEDYVWYAAYGSNIDETRFLCYLEGGRFAVNGRTYTGCRDKSRWIGEDVALYPGTVYASNHSSSWNGKGVAFYDENETDNLIKGFTFMKLYKIRIGQVIDIQR
ncbi:MAG: gamma-glutamylcyclotransferase, partial [Lachnospiraceae bacterium]|nr:gamma-glutamylcyclotransferase [Lachnospiraceae bacterium]